MFSFTHLWAFALIPVPFLLRWLMPAVQQVLSVRLARLPKGLAEVKQQPKLIPGLLIAAWLCLVVALARPVWLGEPISVPSEHRDVMLVVDLSGSMDIEDMTDKRGNAIDRLTAVKEVLSEFVANRQGDRLGLVVFADHGYLHTPLTLDIASLQQQIDQLVLGLVGQMTAIGEGIAIATKTFIESDAPQRVMILLSDGGNTAGVIEPVEAAELAAESDVTLYSVGVGADEMRVRRFFSYETVNPSWDLDEETLTNVAEMTGGQYFRARNQEELANIYNIIDALEPISEANQVWRPRHDLFMYPFAMFLTMFVVIMLLRRRYG
ncbi:vWA domain-containing protein [Thaumasiovibrio subtropicus]|uniref:vWA domain-containing protein n=1 Tax=Thaumasiovibrio subtropicus TaxID=1891207 RepID=UPI000B363186|nr:VWA domain-containing protein [Thaumasiovibrio subtropicus]